MAEPKSEDDGVLREWSSLSGLLREIPLTVRRGLFLESVTLTCVDAVPEHLAVGTNIGVVYWYDRKTHNMQRLRPEKNAYKITNVKVVSSVDFMVAAGDVSGTVTVFRIPKPTPDWISPVYKQNSNTSVERYTVGGLHSAPVTALEWSKNSQKLFSGDATGLVVFTEIDFYMNLSKACEILNEKYRIVQLSFNQNDQTLVVATDYRCIVAHRQDSGWRVVQVGQKERRSLCRLGATFFPHPQRPRERLVFSARPGLRFWQADSEGIVHKTLIFKDSVRKPHQMIRLIHQPPVKDIAWEEDLGPVLVWKGLYLVSYNSSVLVVLDPHNISVVASLCGLSDLHSVCLTQTEIFFIAGPRNIVRLSYTPELCTGTQSESGLSLLEELKVSPVADTLLDITSKLKKSATQFVNNRPATSVYGSVEEDVTTGTDALEFDLPPVIPLDSNVQQLAVQVDPRLQMLDQIGKQSFDDILHSSTRKGKVKDQKMNKYSGSTNGSVSGLESSTDTISVASVRSGESTDSEPNNRPPSRNNNQPPETPQPPHLTLDLVSSSHHSQGTIPPDILPDLRSPDSILKDVHDKEILVAKALNLEEVLLKDTKKVSEEKNQKPSDEASEQREESIGYGPPSGSSSAIPSLDPTNTAVIQDIIRTLKENDGLLEEKEFDYPLSKENCSYEQIKTDTLMEYNDEWCQVPTPESAQYLSVSKDCVCMSGPSRTIHSSPLEPLGCQWRKLGYKAVDLVLSPDGQLVWKVDFGVASAIKDIDTTGPVGGTWEVAAREVESVALSDSCAWYVSAGKVYLQTELSRSRPARDGCLVPCPALVVKVCCSHSMVWVLTADSWVLWRAGITEECLEGTHWQRVNLPAHLLVADIALGPYNVGWIVDRANSIYFSDNYNTDDGSWWQVLIRNYLFENSTLCQISSNENSVWVTNRISPFVYMNNSTIKGHRWVEVAIKNLTAPIRWRHITAEGMFDDEKGSLWLLSSANDLFHLQSKSDNANVIALPCRAEDVSSVSAAPHALWLLTLSGHIHVRQGMSNQCPEGDKWRTLNLEQINDKQVTLSHISCGCDIIWACDTKGDMYMAAGSPYLIATDTFPPAWVQVEGKPLSNNSFVKVFVGSQSHIVWALDNKHNVYVRSGIFHDFLLGTDWVLVPGVQASEITISGSLVWALSTTGSVFCRFGISENNYIGNYWYQVPGTLCHLTASWFTNYHKPLSEGLWGVMDKTCSLVMYNQYSLGVSKSSREALLDESRDDDWEVI